MIYFTLRLYGLKTIHVLITSKIGHLSQTNNLDNSDKNLSLP